MKLIYIAIIALIVTACTVNYFDESVTHTNTKGDDSSVTEVSTQAGNSVCSDNMPKCSSSPPCVGQWVGSSCKIGGITGTCTDTGRKDVGILTPCCSCDNTVAAIANDEDSDEVLPDLPTQEEAWEIQMFPATKMDN